jgi:voltage-gated potassium channel
VARLDFNRSSVLVSRAAAQPGRTLAVRLAIVSALLAFCLVVFYIGRAGLRDQIDGSVSALDVIYFTVVAISTTGFGDIVPISDAMKLFTSFVLTPVRLIVWFILLGTAYEFVVQRLIEVFRMTRIQQTLRDHVIVCGVGDSGATAVDELLARGRDPATIVIIDQDEASCRFAAERGCIALRGDASSESILREAALDRAGTVIVCAGRDDTNVLVTLTVRNMNPHVRLIANVREEENVKLMKQAGATTVVRPAQVVGYILAGATTNTHLVETALDLLDAHGPLRLIERCALASEVGLRASEIEGGHCLRLFRNDVRIEANDASRNRIEVGDLLQIIENGPQPA